MNDYKIFAKSKKEIEILIPIIRIYNQHIRMEFRI